MSDDFEDNDFDPTLVEKTPSFKSKVSAEKAKEVRDGIFGRSPKQKSVGWRLLATMLDGKGSDKQLAVEIALNDARTKSYLERAEKSLHSNVRTSAAMARKAIKTHIGAVFSAPRPKGSVFS